MVQVRKVLAPYVLQRLDPLRMILGRTMPRAFNQPVGEFDEAVKRGLARQRSASANGELGVRLARGLVVPAALFHQGTSLPKSFLGGQWMLQYFGHATVTMRLWPHEG